MTDYTDDIAAVSKQKVSFAAAGGAKAYEAVASLEDDAPVVLNPAQCAGCNSTFDVSSFDIDYEAIAMVPVEVARRYGVLPLKADSHSRELAVVIADLSDVVVVDCVQRTIPNDWRLTLLKADKDQIATCVEFAYGIEKSPHELFDSLEAGCKTTGEQLEIDEDGQGIVSLVRAVLNDAARKGVSDVHFEPEKTQVRMRYRIDGIMRLVRVFSLTHWSAVVVRLKIICNLNITESRLPQDGSTTMILAGRQVECRLSTFPTVNGEAIVVRLLDQDSVPLGLSALGVPPNLQSLLRRIMHEPNGLILVAGPTGSGKTTSLYAMLNEIRGEALNILTLEDPVEIRLPYLRQSSVGESVKLSFAEGIRAMLRQDPDVLLIGETRDAETCSMLLRATLTGHLVMTTLHASDALTALERLRELGMNTTQLGNNLIAIVAQRLVRRLCTRCKTPGRADQEHAVSQSLLDMLTLTTFWQPVGCSHCSETGYAGRIPLMEILCPGAELGNMINQNSVLVSDQREKVGYSFYSMRESVKVALQQGRTSLEEIDRVIRLPETGQ